MALNLPFRFTSLALLLSLCCSPALAQGSSSSSSSGNPPANQVTPPSSSRPIQGPRAVQPEAGGAAITLEVNEPLFDLASALNVCGYDNDLAKSATVRIAVRQEIAQATASSVNAPKSRDALCDYISSHRLQDPGRNIAQYISLALYLSPPPRLAPTAAEPDMPPDALQVINILPLLRTFAEDIDLHLIWLHHRAEYQALLDRVHDPMTSMVLRTNNVLGLPVSSYDGRRFVVLLEPMLGPSAGNARIYANDFIIVAPPFQTATSAELPVRMDQIRHTYLHYVVEPLVYARASSTARLLPLLKPVQDAPLEFSYKSDIVALLTECLIKSIEDRTAYPGIDPPEKPKTKERSDFDRYASENAVYERKTDAFRRGLVTRDERQGWIMVGYFYDRIGPIERTPVSLKDSMGDLVYGMDVDRERHMAQQIPFDKTSEGDVLRRSPRQLSGLDLAEADLLKGKLDEALQLAEKALGDPTANQAEANYVLARLDLMQQLPDEAVDHFQATLKTSTDPRTKGWSHVYLGRLYDTQPDRSKALAEYRAALAVTNLLPDARAAAEKGLKEPFALPKAVKHDDPDAGLDPTGKAEKDAYKPPPQ